MPLPTIDSAAADEAKRITHAANWMHRIMLDFGPNRLIHRPDKRITREFLAVAPWPALSAMLRDLHTQKVKPGHSYAWFVATAQQRINGIDPRELLARRAELRSMARASAERKAEARP
jgi:hypothetical protein